MEFPNQSVSESDLSSDLRLPPAMLTAALDSIAAHVVMLNEDGIIIYVNNAWKEFARRNGYTGSTFWMGTDYISVCPSVAGSSVPLAAQFRKLIEDRSGEFRIDYPCHSPSEKRWFQMRVTCFTETDRFYMVVVHENITEIKLAEKRLESVLQELKLSNELLDDSLMQCISSLGRAIEQRDPYTDGHQKRVSALAGQIAEEMGLSQETVKGIRLGALIHDIGKIHIPAEILSSPRRLSGLEIDLVRTHAKAGYDILKDTHFPWPLAEMVYQHHERLDGSGYPRGLAGDNIIMEARIIAVADVAEAISSHRPYRPAVGLHKAIEELRSGKGTTYDPVAVDACVAILDANPAIMDGSENGFAKKPAGHSGQQE
ncbi:MAG: HD-GYP domain-containing protein [Leptospiraceae bacterium]|nr:HD-GYP domain-containing protein [Leptospiraceae bacterium]MCB1305315.1 HD-GYP domain-containing protein [Leptospiraceae bacterium]